jgi:hypothetical protein
MCSTYYLTYQRQLTLFSSPNHHKFSYQHIMIRYPARCAPPAVTFSLTTIKSIIHLNFLVRCILMDIFPAPILICSLSRYCVLSNFWPICSTTSFLILLQSLLFKLISLLLIVCLRYQNGVPIRPSRAVLYLIILICLANFDLVKGWKFQLRSKFH